MSTAAHLSAANVDDGKCYTKGCTDPTATNYASGANVKEDQSCTYLREGCTNNAALNFHSWAEVDDGSCAEVVTGCTDSSYGGYDASATTLDIDQCVLPIEGCMTEGADNYNPLAEISAGTVCVFTGCMDPSHSLYDATANAPVVLGMRERYGGNS